MTRKNRDHLSMLCDIGELADLLTGSEDIFTFLDRSVEMVARHLNADASSIYLYDQKSANLILFATIGLNPRAVGMVRMKIGEGLVGTTIQKRKPVFEDNYRIRYKCSDDQSFLSN